MGTFLSFLVMALRVFLSIKAMILLGKCYIYPETYGLDGLKWYICFFIFDMWFMKVNSAYYEQKINQKDEE